MKNFIIFTIFLSIFCINTINAQNISGGLKGGANFSFFTEDTGDDGGYVGFDIGYFEELDFANQNKLQIELIYANSGYKNSKAKIRYSFNYFEIPVLFKREIASGINLGVGVKYAFGLSGKSVQEGEGDDSDRITDMSASGGLGYLAELQIVAGKLNFGLRVNIGSGQVLNAYERKSVNLYIGYAIF